MTLIEKIVSILEERSFEIKEGATKMTCVESTDFEQIAMDIVEVLGRDFDLPVDSETEEKAK